MRVAYSWLKDFVDIKVSPEKLADKLTMAGLTVASLESVNDDWIYEIEVTSNRPDWLSIRGIAHEVAAITNARLKSSPSHNVTKSHAKTKRSPKPEARSLQPVSIRIDDKSACKVYYGNLIEGIKVSVSPDWLAKRLVSVGIRPVNNVVDITNYCLMELGQPLHAFDFDKIKEGLIIVRRAKEGERLTLIDGSEKTLTNKVLVIADSQKPLAVAGIMGGQYSEVAAKTTRILLESAYFDSVVVRRGTRVLGVSSDSSYRFERGVDPITVKGAFEKATDMICDLCEGRRVACASSGIVKLEKKSKITFDIEEVNRVLSLQLKPKDAANILTKLGFEVRTKKSGIIEAVVPSFRRDVKAVEDITEEIARTYGYDKIPLTKPAITPFLMPIQTIQALEPKVKNLLVSLGLKEIISYSLIAKEDYQKTSLRVPADTLILENPLSEDNSILRSTLCPSMLRHAAFNTNYNNKDFEVFEIAHVFKSGSESLDLAICLCGKAKRGWQKEAKPYTFFDCKGILENLFDETGIKNYLFKRSADLSLLGQNAQASIIAGDGKIGFVGQVNDRVKKNWGIKTKGDIFIAEISLESLAQEANFKKHFQPLVLTPSIFRDISMLADEKTSYAQIEALILTRTQGFLRSVSLVDCYQGKEIPAGHLGLTVSLEYGSGERTLTDNEVNLLHKKILDSLTQELSVALR